MVVLILGKDPLSLLPACSGVCPPPPWLSCHGLNTSIEYCWSLCCRPPVSVLSGSSVPFVLPDDITMFRDPPVTGTQGCGFKMINMMSQD